MPLTVEALYLVCDFMITQNQALGGAAQDDAASQLFAMSEVCKNSRKVALQAAGWRARAHARRNSWRAVSRAEASQVRDLNHVLRDIDGRDEIYGPLRVRHIVRVLDATLTSVDAMLRVRPRLRPMWSGLEAVATHDVRQQEADDGDRIFVDGQ